MTISFRTKTNSQLTAYHFEQDGEKGYILNVGTAQVFVNEKDADNLARYMLFAEPEDSTAGQVDADKIVAGPTQ